MRFSNFGDLIPSLTLHLKEGICLKEFCCVVAESRVTFVLLVLYPTVPVCLGLTIKNDLVRFRGLGLVPLRM